MSALPLCLLITSCAAAPKDSGDFRPLENEFAVAGSSLEGDAGFPPGEGEAPRVSAGSRNPPSISLETAVRQALSWHPSIDQAVGRLNQQTEEVAGARGGYLPKISGGIRSVYDNDDDRIRPELTVSASQPIYDFGKVSSTVKAEMANVGASRAELLIAIDTVIRDTAHAFIETQRNQQLLDVAKDQVEGVEAIADLVRQRTSNGASTRSDEVQAEARVQTARSRVLEIDAQLSRWETTLATLIGSHGAAVPVGDVPSWLLSSCEVVEPEWSRVPAIIRAEAQLERAQAELRLSRAQLFPTLSVQADAGQSLDGSSLGGGTRDSDLTIGLNLSGSLYDGGTSLARRRAASHALGAAQAMRETARIETLQELTNARSQTANMKQLLASLSSRSEMMRETRNLYRRQYVDLGTRTLLDLLNAEQELHQAQFDAVNTTHDLRRLNVDCLFSSGTSREAFALDGMTLRGVPLRL